MFHRSETQSLKKERIGIALDKREMRMITVDGCVV